MPIRPALAAALLAATFAGVVQVHARSGTPAELPPGPPEPPLISQPTFDSTQWEPATVSDDDRKAMWHAVKATAFAQCSMHRRFLQSNDTESGIDIKRIFEEVQSVSRFTGNAVAYRFQTGGLAHPEHRRHGAREVIVVLSAGSPLTVARVSFRSLFWSAPVDDASDGAVLTPGVTSDCVAP